MVDDEMVEVEQDSAHAAAAKLANARRLYELCILCCKKMPNSGQGGCGPKVRWWMGDGGLQGAMILCMSD